MLNQIIELAKYEVPITLKSLKNSFDELITHSTLYSKTIFFREFDSNMGWIKGIVQNRKIRIIFSRVPEAEKREDIKDNDNIIIVRIVDVMVDEDLYKANLGKEKK